MLRIGRFTVDPVRHGLYRDGVRVHLTPKPFETLLYLIERHGQTVEKQELLNAVWKDTAVTEDTLVQAVHEIRRVLEDDRADPRFLQTVPRHGYRFVGEVMEEAEPVASGLRSIGGAAPRHDSVPSDGGAAGERWTWTWRLSGAAALVATVVILIAVAWRPARTDAPLTPGVLEQLTSEGISAGKPAVSADGNLLYNSGGALYIRPAGSDTAIRITDQILPSGDMPVFTADGAAVVFAIPRDGEDGSRMHDLYKVPSIGGPPRLFLTEASGAGFSPDGKWVAYTRHLSGRNPLWISPVDALGEHVEVRASGYVPRWSPDGRRIAYTTADPNATSGELWVAAVSRAKSGALQVSDHTRLTSEPQPMYGLSWTPDGRSIVFAARHAGSPMHLYQVPASGGAVTALTKGAGDYACPSVTPDGTRVIFWQGTGVKDLMVADGLIDAPTRAITEDEFHLWPALSPSGTHIASIVRRPSYEDRLYATEIVVNKRVALSTRAARHPSWVDGDTVAYLEDTSSGQTAVQLVNLTAGPSPLKLTEFTGHAAWVAVHPQKTSVAVVVKSDEGRQRILLRQADGRRPDRTLSLGAEYEHLRWLPGGSALSWSGPERSADPKSNGIWVVEIEGSAPRRIVADGYGPVWAADGKAVFFSRIRQYSGLWKYDLRDGTETELRQWPETSNEFDIVGERLVLTQQGGRGRIFSMSLER